MNKIYLSFFAVCMTLIANAQLTQANQAPVPSYSYAMYHCDSVNTDPGFSGANVLWNYSSIETYTDLVTSYTTANATNSSYPNATVVVGSSQGTQLYYSSTINNLSLYGGNLAFGGVDVELIYNAPATAIVYPMSLNTSTPSAISGSVTITGAQIPLSGTFTGNYNVIADGSGTLILPGINATFTNALRVVTGQTLYVDMAGTLPIIGTIAATGTITLQNYEFYSIGTRNPLFTIQNVDAIIDANGQVIPFSQTTVLRDITTGVAASTPTTNFSLSTNTTCLMNNVTITNNSSGTPAPSYVWSSSSSNVIFQPSNTVATPNISFSTAGTYTIVLTATNVAGSNSYSQTITVDNCLGITENSSGTINLNVYPNPASIYVNFVCESPNATTVKVFDLRGKLIRELSFVNGQVKMDMVEMPDGFYLYSVKSGDGNTLKNGKITISH